MNVCTIDTVLSPVNPGRHSAMLTRGVMAGGGQEGSWPLQFSRSHRIFGNLNVSSENCRTLAGGKNKGFELYRKIFELAPLLYRCQDAPDADLNADQTHSYVGNFVPA